MLENSSFMEAPFNVIKANQVGFRYLIHTNLNILHVLQITVY